MTIKMITDTPNRVSNPYNIRLSKYFCTARFHLEVVSLVLHSTKQGPNDSRRNSRSDKNDCASPWEAMDHTSEHSS
jgi:hypothetical protein